MLLKIFINRAINWWTLNCITDPNQDPHLRYFLKRAIYKTLSKGLWGHLPKKRGFASQKTLTLTGLLATGWLNSKMNGKRPLCFGRFGPPSHKSYNPKCTIFKTQCAWATTLSTVNNFLWIALWDGDSNGLEQRGHSSFSKIYKTQHNKAHLLWLLGTTKP